MSLRLKVALIVVGIFLFYGISNFGIQRFIIYPSFLSLEQEEAIKDAMRVERAINREIHHLDSFVHDWSSWDDTYEFIETFSSDYINTNLSIATFTDNKLNLIYYCNKDGKVAWGKIYDLETEAEIHVDLFSKDRLPKTHPLISYKTENKPLSHVTVSGVYMTSKGPMVISSRPILTSRNEGPMNGSLIMGRFITASMVILLADQTRVDFQIFPVQTDSISETIKGVSSQLTDKSTYLIETIKGGDQMQIYTAYPDIKGNTVLLIKSTIPRKIAAKGLTTIRYAILSVMLAGFGALIVILLLLQWVVLKPITRLTGHAMKVRETGDLSIRLSSQRQDEIGILANEFEDMLTQLGNRSAELKEMNKKLQADIDKRKRTEKALRESEEKLARSRTMESMGLLAGGVAHDLNNVLSGIVSYPELILINLPEDSEFRKPIVTMLESGLRAAAIVQDLLTVARGAATTKKPLNLNDIVSDYLNSPEFQKLKQFHPAVTVKTDLNPDLLNVSGSHVHVRKLVMNLISNAAEAIEDDGNVTISTINLYVDKPLRGYDDVSIGEYTVLSISDDGSGISSDDLERIFEPFYTKKVMGRSGTGLGLAVVWNVVQDHKGYINVTSDVNGTTFELYFPITRDEIWDKDIIPLSINDYKGNKETILIVDDVKSQREISCKILDTLGYNAKAVSSGEKAIEYLKENTVDLILLDMIMDPGINGRETYERIIRICPGQKAIIVSGFAETDDVKEAQKLGAGQYVKKPVTLERIGLAIKEEFEK